MPDAPYLDEAFGIVYPIEDFEASGVGAAVLVHEPEIPAELVDGEAQGVLGDLASMSSETASAASAPYAWDGTD